MAHDTPDAGKVRLDKWLWAARFYKTRSLSAEDIQKGRVQVNGAPAKPGREVRLSDVIELRHGPVLRTVVVRALSGVRGPATAAALLYEETAESLAQRAALAERRRLAPEPADSIAQGRPSKRDRRELDAWRQPPANWNERWSASIDDDE
ncbi:MAG: RNA-binding S4 domain-containing protein [Hydrogenophaga sp.]|jgi:ribosome-associated heat shock protein Hsp15|nr:RNA-binding S4 domain-containing protein [Hydrogenophaga sp.]